MKKPNLSLPATKKDLEKLATKKELKQEIGGLEQKIDGAEKALRAEIKITAQETKEEIREEIRQSESRVLGTLDAFLSELEDSRQERTIAAHQTAEDREKLKDHEKRIGILEQKASVSS